MVVKGGSKPRLDTPFGPGKPSTVHRILSLLVPVTLLAPLPVTAQAPPSAGLWRVAAGALARPAPLQTGATGSFWNPGATGRTGSTRGLRIGGHVVQTSNILGVSGLLLGGSAPISSLVRAGAVLGRMQVRDLVRTTTSPDGEDGTIPVYEQFAGVGVSAGTPRVEIGATLLLHDSRFDVLDDGGVTFDLGIRFAPWSRLRIAAATHLLPIDFSSEPSTDYFAAGEYLAAERLELSGIPTALMARYGIAFRASGDTEHTVGFGAVVGDRVVVDAALTGESGYGSRQWRPAVGVGLRFGPYLVSLAHGFSLNDLGGTFRIGLDIEP